MKSEGIFPSGCALRRKGGAVLLAVLCWFAAGAAAQSAPGPGNTFVHTALGGFILGYDIDRTGTEGVLSEALTLPDGKHNVAVETFDQRTGKIIKVVMQKTETQDDFVTLGVASHTGLIMFERSRNGFVSGRQYRVMNPLTSNQFTGLWTPALTKDDIIMGVRSSQGSNSVAVLAFENGGSNNTFVFGSDVVANTFGPLITLTDPAFFFANAPVVALDSTANQAVLGTMGGNPFGPPKIATVDLATGAVSEFTGVGIGYVNGIAVDPATRIACTSTEIDFSVEFYDLTTQTGFAVPLPGAVSQAQSGAEVEFDPIHKLFLVAQPVTSTGGSGSSIQVFDEQGNFIESINGLNLPVSPTTIALHPGRRFGYVLVTPDLMELQSFTY